MRRRLLILVGVLATAVIVPAALELHARHRKVARGRFIDQEHCDRIEDGMSQAEVEAILGGPPGDFRTRETAYGTPGMLYHPIVDGGFTLTWFADGGKVSVIFLEKDGRAMENWFDSGRPADSCPWLERMRKRFGR
jgi:hypothetical protein